MRCKIDDGTVVLSLSGFTVQRVFVGVELYAYAQEETW